MSRCDLDVLSLAVEHLLYIKCHVIMALTKFEPNRASPEELLIIYSIFAPDISRYDLAL